MTGQLGDGILTDISETISNLVSSGSSNENILDSLVKQHHVLLHGSRIAIRDSFLRPNQRGEVFTTNDARIAILRSIYSNRGLTPPGLEYPYFIGERSPLTLRIHGINPNTIGDNGFVYIITRTEAFYNSPRGSWQFVKMNTNVPFSNRITTIRSDFIYPVYDVTNNRIIQ